MLCFFDLATQTGVAWGQGETLPLLDSIRMPSGDEGEYFDFFETWACDFLAARIAEAGGRRVFVGFESPFLAGARWDKTAGRLVQAQTNIQTLRKLYGLASFLQTVCYRFSLEYAPGVICEEASGSTLKKLLSGSGKGEKLDMWASARNLGAAPKSHDEADALAGFLLLVKTYRLEMWQEWEPKVMAARVLVPVTAKRKGTGTRKRRAKPL